MNPKIILCLALVLSGGLFGCSTAHHSTVTNVPEQIDPATGLPTEQPAYVEENQIFELKVKLWEAVRVKNAEKFIDCYYIEERFNTIEVREANRKAIEKFLQGEIVDMEVLEIPKSELDAMMKIQNARAGNGVGYSLTPKKMLAIRCKAENGWIGRRFLIGNKNDKWYIVTFAGHTT